MDRGPGIRMLILFVYYLDWSDNHDVELPRTSELNQFTNSVHFVCSSMWVTPRRYHNGYPFLHISASYGTVCQPEQRLSEFGPITIGEQYHIKIKTNETFTIVQASSSSKSGVYTFPRDAPTQSDHLGRIAGVWFMSGKFGSTEYNRGNGSFSNIILTSSQFGEEGDDSESTHNMFAPDDSPPSTTLVIPQSSSNPNLTTSSISETTVIPKHNDQNDNISSSGSSHVAETVQTTKSHIHHSTASDGEEFMSISPVLLIALLIIILLVVVICVACCIVAYLCGRQSRKAEGESPRSKIDWTDARSRAITEMDRLNFRHDLQLTRMSLQQLATTRPMTDESRLTVLTETNTNTITPPVADQEEDSVMAVADNLQLVRLIYDTFISMMNLLVIFNICYVFTL